MMVSGERTVFLFPGELESYREVSKAATIPTKTCTHFIWHELLLEMLLYKSVVLVILA